ncbi:MAG: tRNA 2-thiouridine(34) synthase MnmA [Fimbriimonadaceae bacterium]|jgi:tRNA-specific 2-thiouridylase|nr:tRNA 2-thiouridine(34) synthase MnmA [Fimbriimonadaceae bacterium]
MKKKPLICVAMSGGVDSSVVPILLREQGYDVIGVTMQIWQESQTDPRHAGCCSLGAVEDARRVARILDIPHYVINFKDTFRETVIDEFIEEYSKGRTPNPCVTCNKKVKFEALLAKMQELGCDALATGHYARVRKNVVTGRYELLRAAGGAKDQSYVLYTLSQTQLSQVMFPLGELGDKAETRQMAREAGLPVADKPDSQEICFVSDAGGYKEFLRKSRPEVFEKGELVTPDGEVLGHHAGLADFTVGQRRGLGVAKGKPLYVIGLEPKQNRVVVGEEADLLKTEVPLSEVVWSATAEQAEPIRVMAKIRYNMTAQPATLYGGTNPKVVFDEPVKAVTPGQIAVAYDGDVVVAGGKIR